jgi:inner membrane protein
MDNVCHTLVGAAMSRAGLHRTTRLAGATLMIAANLPDLDVLVFATDAPSIAFRRGWTHGVLAQAVLPLALTGVMLLVGRGRPGAAGKPPLRAGWLLALSYLGLFSHVFLDFLNTYGIRLLAPFDWRWFYGDAVFIIDPWLWLMLGAGVWLSARRASTWPARAALAAAAMYVAVMLGAASWSRGVVLEAWAGQGRAAPRAVMVGPMAVTPFRKQIIVDAGDHYQTGELRLFPSRVSFDSAAVPKNENEAEVRMARQAPPVRAFLVWSRFPFYALEPGPDGVHVSVSDMRFANAGGLRSAVARGRFTQTVIVPRGAE